MAYRDCADMESVRETFLTTHWSLIEGVKEHVDQDRALIGLLWSGLLETGVLLSSPQEL